jgi:hypothetical protein
MTDVYEGSLVRLFRRLEELLRQVAQASKVMGSEDLEQKFTAALELIRRDIVSIRKFILGLHTMLTDLPDRGTVSVFVDGTDFAIGDSEKRDCSLIICIIHLGTTAFSMRSDNR